MSESESNETRSVPGDGAAYYSHPTLMRSPRRREWWTVLHPPYTMLHLSFVVVGGCLAAPVNFARLGVSVAAFFLAVGIGAHCLDEYHDRPLGTFIPRRQLMVVAIAGLVGAVGLGVVGLVVVSGFFALFMIVGVVIAVAYNLELFHGRLHTELVFVAGWGSFPVLTGYFAQHSTLSLASVVVAVFAALVTLLQRTLSTPARQLRRRTLSVQGQLTLRDERVVPLTKAALLLPLERSLRLLCWSGVTLAVGLLMLRAVGS
ncbi:MAG TPA: hypothetical protein VMU98_08830 [Acidimicrobiales bacterium]|nr:hypothetical protein [Acidimicrobiales bacterium]